MAYQQINNKIIAVGIGPGAPEYIIPAALTAITNAAVLVGSQRALADYDNKHCETYPITGDLNGVLAFIAAKLTNTDVVVMLSGDPGYYSMLAALRSRFGSERLKVIPGISSMQLAFSRLALPWQEAVLTSLHGRQPDETKLTYVSGKILGLLTDKVYTSRTIAEYLLKKDWPPDTQAYVLTRLSYTDEKIIDATLGELTKAEEITHCIMVVTA